jgi:signal peptidase I
MLCKLEVSIIRNQSYRLLLCGYLLLFPFILPACSSPGVSTYRVVGFSMLPNFEDGQLVKVQQVPLSELRRVDVVLVNFPNGAKYLRRLVGMPGETIAVHDGQVFVNGTPLNEPYRFQLPTYTQQPLLLRNDEYYMLGDNRDQSYDSHSVGPIQGNKIEGKVIP